MGSSTGAGTGIPADGAERRTSGKPTGLTAAELELVLAELREDLDGATVDASAMLAERDDLLLFVRTRDGGRRALHVAPGGPRARICWTRRRFSRRTFATGPRPDALDRLLEGARFVGAEQPDGERRCSLSWTARADGRVLRLEVELFGSRGLWCVTDDAGRILSLSRLPNVRGRELRPGAVYQPPPPRPRVAAPVAESAAASAAAALPPPAPRFAAPASTAIDALFTGLDRAEESTARLRRARGAVDRALRRAQGRAAGLERRRAAMNDAPELQRRADLLLAYQTLVRPGDTTLRVPDPDSLEDPASEVEIPIDPRRPVHLQAAALYERARKYRDGRAATDRQLETVRAELAALGELAARLDRSVASADLDAPDGELGAVEEELRRRGLLAGDVSAGARARTGARARAQAPTDPRERRRLKVTRGENVRCFTSVEGYWIFAGRDAAQSDRLTLRIARGNDLWFHVGRGYAGSHVVLRLDKGKTASLESLLDAATLAVHFSKARGAQTADVVYTAAKNVKKPKGMPPGKVVPAHTKTLRVRAEPERLRRLLESGSDS